jgi:hypothetical protein
MVEEGQTSPEPVKDGKKNQCVLKDALKAKLVGVNERIRIDAKGYAAKHAIEEKDDRIEEPDGGIGPSQAALGDKH